MKLKMKKLIKKIDFIKNWNKLIKKVNFITPFFTWLRIRKYKRLAKYIGKSFPYNKKTRKKLKRIALKLHDFRGVQYHLIPVGSTHIAIINNIWLKAYNKTVHQSKRIDYNKMLKEVYFSTGSQRLIKRANRNLLTNIAAVLFLISSGVAFYQSDFINFTLYLCIVILFLLKNFKYFD